MGWVERGDIPLNAVAKGAEGDDVVIREHDLEQGDVVHHGRGDGGDEEEDGGGEEEEGAEVVEESHFDDLFRSSLLLFVDIKSSGSRSSRVYEADEYRERKRKRKRKGKRKRDERQERDAVLILPHLDGLQLKLAAPAGSRKLVKIEAAQPALPRTPMTRGTQWNP